MKFTVVGAGLAGIALADSLVEAGVEPSQLCVVDDADPRRGSSSPAIILHPFPGRRMDLRRGQGDAFERGWARLNAWSDALGDDWWDIHSMVRPLTDDDKGAQLRESWESARNEYPELIEIELMSPDEVARQFPGIEPSVESLVYRPAASVMLSELLQRLRDRLEEQGVRFVDDRMVEMTSSGGGWTLGLDGGEQLESDTVVLAVGASLDEYFPGLDLRRKAGEIVVLDPGAQKLPALVNANKHMAARSDGLWGLGSTYFRVSEWDDRDDDAVAEELKAGIVDVVPAVADAEVVEVWRGERGVFGSDHMPLVGPVPGNDGLFCCAAFGSKGLLWALAAAQDLAVELCTGREVISKYMRTTRMSDDKWEW